jgi:hypothetical protein
MTEENKNKSVIPAEKIEPAATPGAEDYPEEVKEFIDKLPPDKKSDVLRIFSEQRTMFAGPLPSLLERKITPEHISSIIETEEKKSQREFQSGESSKKYNLWYLCVGILGFLAFAFVLLQYNAKEFLIPVLTGIAGLVGGFGIGRGKRKE